MKHKILITMLAGRLLAAETPTTTQAPTPTSPPKEAARAPAAEAQYTKPANMFVSAEDLSQNRIEAQRDAYLKERGWELGFSKQNPGQAYLGWGSASITLPRNDIKYGQSRVLAFEKAAMVAMGGFASARLQTISTETIRSFLNDDRPLPDDGNLHPAGRFKILGDKAVALAEAEIDKKLRDLNVDPASVAQATPEKKRKIGRAHV